MRPPPRLAGCRGTGENRLMAPGSYSVRSAARRAGRHRTTVQRWLNEGLPHRRVSDQVVEIEEADLTEWLRRKILSNPIRPGVNRRTW
jgi:hypothetical protein